MSGLDELLLEKIDVESLALFRVAAALKHEADDGFHIDELISVRQSLLAESGDAEHTDLLDGLIDGGGHQLLALFVQVNVDGASDELKDGVNVVGEVLDIAVLNGALLSHAGATLQDGKGSVLASLNAWTADARHGHGFLPCLLCRPEFLLVVLSKLEMAAFQTDVLGADLGFEPHGLLHLQLKALKV